jgi:(S)-ureidoglycine aminohydrolase
MHHLGQTRSAYRADHLLSTPDTFIPAPLPGMRKATAIVHVSPARGAAFTQFTALFESGGELGPASLQRFFYVIEGKLEVAGKTFEAGGYGYLPAGQNETLRAISPARAAIIEKLYLPLSEVAPPAAMFGNEAAVESQPVLGDDDLQVRTLLPADLAFDFAINTLTYQPGATLPMVEIHVMEHGLLMLAGGGIYRLGDSWYAVTEGDFIWMAPYCPQWFGALGKQPAKYLIYKDWNR